jgi:hypothetical protein
VPLQRVGRVIEGDDVIERPVVMCLAGRGGERERGQKKEKEKEKEVGEAVEWVWAASSSVIHVGVGSFPLSRSLFCQSNRRKMGPKL